MIPNLTIQIENKLNRLVSTKNISCQRTDTSILLFPNLPWASFLPKLQPSCSWTEPQSWPITLKTESCLGGSPVLQVHMKSCHHSVWRGSGVGRPEEGLTKTERIQRSNARSRHDQPFPTPAPHTLGDRKARPTACPGRNCTLPLCQEGWIKANRVSDPAYWWTNPALQCMNPPQRKRWRFLEYTHSVFHKSRWSHLYRDPNYNTNF